MIMKERDSKKSPGAGVILLQYRNNEIHVLGLFKNEYFDLPKGRKQENESDLECAKRECWEESTITKIDFFKDVNPIKLKHLTLFLATTTQDGYVLPNPKTSELEHEYARWLPIKSAAFYVTPYLRPAIIWAREVIEDFNLYEDIKRC
jgi:8-oxo-dGTP pyrophosphatase MutT (NUDIX family)|tara:strand:- start:287 stop:730 length:444 start_codon:yes stop_codon:yes gene_type:complete